jgi:hypothetical protein
MDMEKLTQLKTRVDNLSEASQVSEYREVVRLIGDLYKIQIAGVLNAATSPTLATERAAAEIAIAALITEMNFPTNVLKK